MNTINEQAVMFAALSDPTRLKLLKLLCMQPEDNALCVNALANVLEISQPAVSQHLKTLKSVGLINGQRRGYHVHYFVNPDVLKRWQEVLFTSLSTKNVSAPDVCETCMKKTTPRK
jgi:ArsR family transcriptional regulator, arsenate/arsenite/antimonite-responsive transcriptional repressor